MKINYKNTALGLLEKCDPYSFGIIRDREDMQQAEATALGMSIVKLWPSVSHACKDKIRYLSSPFYQAYEKAVLRLLPVLDQEPMEEYGTFVYRTNSKETNTVFYALSAEGKGKEFKLGGFVFIFNNVDGDDKPRLAMCAQRNAAGIKEFISKKGRENGCTNITIFADIYTMLLFIKYCEVETKIVKPNKKETHVGSKYLNETKTSIEVMDSTWFTTIIRSEGFTVGKETGGFFRMQPCGKDMADRKLKWIYPFEKHGYTRKAKILTNE